MDIKACTIEVPFGALGDKTLMRIVGKNNMVIRNITFTHANAQDAAPLSLDNCKNMLIEGCHFDWNKFHAIYIGSGEKITIKHSTFDHNGKGLFARGKWMRVEDSSMSFNHDCTKVCRQYDSLFLRVISVGSQGGLHTDVGCERVVFEKCFCYGMSDDAGITLELSEFKKGDCIIRNCVVSNNKGGGVNVMNSSQTKIVGNLAINNDGYQIRIENQPRDGWPTYIANDWMYLDIKNNILASNRGNLIGGPYKAWVVNDVSSILPIINASGNQYFQNDGTKSFKVGIDNYTDFAGWKQKLSSVNAPGKQDANSIWKNPGLSASPEADFTPGSPIFELAQKTGTPIPTDLIQEYNSNKWSK
jgi:parallel beta-helix repeat protein